MAVNIDVITGFLESGKTTFIEEMLQNETLKQYENPLFIICEEGLKEFEAELIKTNRINTLVLQESFEQNNDLLLTIEKDYNPDYIVIEYNGTWDITELLSISKPSHYHIRNVIFISDARSFPSHLSNLTSLIQPPILNSNLVVFNRAKELDAKEKNRFKKLVHGINKNTEVIFSEQWSGEKRIMKYLTPFETYQRISPGMIAALIILSALSIMPYAGLESVYGYMQGVSVYFISIVMQAVPFILLGSFVSSFIQFMIPVSFLVSRFTADNYKSYFFAAIAGFFFPVCDCGLIPMVSGLLKKGAPLPQTMVFWLTSAAVNPVVILSVLYAFPDKPYMAFLRIVTGIVIGLCVGILLKVGTYTTRETVREEGFFGGIGSNLIQVKGYGLKDRLKAVFYGAKLEFFRVLKFVIYGAFLSSMLQYSLSPAMKNLFGEQVLVQFFIMLLAAFFMSTCSTSNAFIGRSFIANFSPSFVLAFIVLGPMVDFKNLIMLTEVLKKRFLIHFVLLVCLTGLFIFSLLHMFL